jgi:hypothetical protein
MTKTRIRSNAGGIKPHPDTRVDAHDSQGAITLLRSWCRRYSRKVRDYYIELRDRDGRWVAHRDES